MQNLGDTRCPGTWNFSLMVALHDSHQVPIGVGRGSWETLNLEIIGNLI